MAIAIEHKQALDNLNEREEKYRRLIETTSAGCWQVNQEDITVNVNPVMCDMVGYPKDEMLDKTPLDFVDEKSKTEYQNQLEKSFVLSDKSYEIMLTRKDSERIYVRIDTTSMFDDGGEFLGSFTFVTDITLQINS
jgi:PAS domain S-box-containing protein